MTTLPFRIAALTLAVALCTSSLPKAYAYDGAADKTPQHVAPGGSDRLAAQSDGLMLFEALLLGLALLEETHHAVSACPSCAGARGNDAH